MKQENPAKDKFSKNCNSFTKVRTSHKLQEFKLGLGSFYKSQPP